MRVPPMRFAFEISFLQNLMDPYDFYVALILDLWIAWTRFREFVAVRKKVGDISKICVWIMFRVMDCFLKRAGFPCAINY